MLFTDFRNWKNEEAQDTPNKMIKEISLEDNKNRVKLGISRSLKGQTLVRPTGGPINLRRAFRQGADQYLDCPNWQIFHRSLLKLDHPLAGP